MSIAEEKLRRAIDEELAPRFEDARTYLAYAPEEDFAVEGAELLYVRDQYHTQYLDFSNGFLLPLGHRNPAVHTRIAEQLAHYGPVGIPSWYLQRWAVEYAKRLVESLPASALEPQKVLFFSNDTEAFETALDMAQRSTDRTQFVREFDLGQDWIDVAAYIPHLVSREGKLSDPPMVGLTVTAAHEHGALVIADERIAGFGRTGKVWSQERWEFAADITVVGGAAGGGFPFGAVVAPKRYFEDRSGAMLHYQGGHPAIYAAGLQTLNALTPELMEHVTSAHTVFGQAIADLREQFPDLIVGHSGVGLIFFVKFPDIETARQFVVRARGVGLLLSQTRFSTIMLTPPLITSELELRRGVDLMASVCMDWEA